MALPQRLFLQNQSDVWPRGMETIFGEIHVNKMLGPGWKQDSMLVQFAGNDIANLHDFDGMGVQPWPCEANDHSGIRLRR